MVVLIMYCFLQWGAGDLGVILGAEGDSVVLLIMYCFLQQSGSDQGVILGAGGQGGVINHVLFSAAGCR